LVRLFLSDGIDSDFLLASILLGTLSLLVGLASLIAGFIPKFYLVYCCIEVIYKGPTLADEWPSDFSTELGMKV
jgi:hypothetical protein